MGKTNYKGLRVDYQPGQKVKVMLGRDWFDAEVVKANKKTVIVNTLFSKTKYRRVPIKPGDIAGAGKAGMLAAAIAATSQVPGGLGTVLEPYTVSGTKIVKLPRVRVKPIEMAADVQEIKITDLPEPEHEGPGLGKDEAPLVDYDAEFVRFNEPLANAVEKAFADKPDPEPKAETKPETAADVLAELEDMLS